MKSSQDPVASRWSKASVASDYAGARWRSRRARERDPRILRAWLRSLDLPGKPRLLDVPSGTGRLRQTLEAFGQRTAVDVSPAMVQQEGRAAGIERVRGLVGSISQLPFQAGSFDVVVCCRLLHHLRDPRDRIEAIREMLRVSDRYVLASFWDRGSLHGLRAERKSQKRPPTDGRRRTRHALPKSQLFAEFESCGGRVLGVRHSFRYVSQQAFIAVQKTGTAPGTSQRSKE